MCHSEYKQIDSVLVSRLCYILYLTYNYAAPIFIYHDLFVKCLRYSLLMLYVGRNGAMIVGVNPINLNDNILQRCIRMILDDK